MAAKTMVLNLYGAIGDAIENITMVQVSNWRAATPDPRMSKSELNEITAAYAYKTKKEAGALEEEIKAKRAAAIAEHRAEKPSRVAVVYEIIELGIEAYRKKHKV